MKNAVLQEQVRIVRDRKLKNEGRKNRDWQMEAQPYPKKIDRLDLVGIEEEDDT